MLHISVTSCTCSWTACILVNMGCSSEDSAPWYRVKFDQEWFEEHSINLTICDADHFCHTWAQWSIYGALFAHKILYLRIWGSCRQQFETERINSFPGDFGPREESMLCYVVARLQGVLLRHQLTLPWLPACQSKPGCRIEKLYIFDEIIFFHFVLFKKLRRIYFLMYQYFSRSFFFFFFFQLAIFDFLSSVNYVI